MTTGNRHICSTCGAKRHEKYMRMGCKNDITRFNFQKWYCNDQYCGQAWTNQHFCGKTSRIVHHDHGGLLKQKGRK